MAERIFAKIDKNIFKFDRRVSDPKLMNNVDFYSKRSLSDQGLHQSITF